jgi:hypothetical protein
MVVEYPEHEKLKALGGANQTVGDFIEWLGQKGWEIARMNEHDELVPIFKRRDTLIAEFFEIDPNKLKAEKRAMLDSIRSQG